MKAYKVVAPFALIAALSTATASAASGVALGAGVGSLGGNINLTYGLSEKFNLRGLLNKYSYADDGEQDGINYEGELSLSSFGLLADYHPWVARGFRVSGGFLINNNELNLSATSPDSAEIGDRTYDIDGEVKSDITFDSNALYAGIGWGNPVARSKRLTFMTDLGVLFQGSPTSSFDPSGSATDQETNIGFTIGDGSDADLLLQEEIAKEKKNLDDEMKDFKMYPVISIGLAYSF